jgi:hypothetical protein
LFQNEGKDLVSSDMETICGRSHSLEASRISNNLTRIQLAQGGNINPGHNQPATNVICDEFIIGKPFEGSN